MGNIIYEPNGRSFTEVIRSILNEPVAENKKAPSTKNGDVGQSTNNKDSDTATDN